MSARLSVAIVGSGPSAMFTAEALVETGRAVEIDILERLPVPFGLVRFGVAPDHPQTKTVSDKFDRILEHPAVRYFGNVDVGRDIGLHELRSMYDAVVLATGAQCDAPPSIPGRELVGVYGAAEFVGWYNGHPGFQRLSPALDCSAVAIVGLGNVALDIARLLASTEAKLQCTDITDDALQALSRAKVSDIYIIGRRGPLEARFTNPELRELGTLDGAMPMVAASQLPPPDTVGASRQQLRNLKTFWDFARLEKRPGFKRVHFLFHSAPTRILGTDRVQGLRLQRSEMRDGKTARTASCVDISCGAVISAIGFRSAPITGAPFDSSRGIVPNDDGRVGDGLYVVGWIKRGPSGVIGTNKPDGALAAQRIVTDCAGGSKAGRQALLDHICGRSLPVVDASGWRRIDAAERAGARRGAPRRKLTSVADMLAAARS